MRRLRGKSKDSNSETKFRTELRELRSSPITMISVSGFSDIILALASSAAFRLLAGNTSLAPLFASTLAVSAPIPDVAPKKISTKNHFFHDSSRKIFKTESALHPYVVSSLFFKIINKLQTHQ